MTTTTIRTPVDRRGIVSVFIVVALALVAAAFVAAALVRTHTPATPAGLPGAAAAPGAVAVTGLHNGALAAAHHDGGRVEQAGVAQGDVAQGDVAQAPAAAAAGNRSWVREDGGRAEG